MVNSDETLKGPLGWKHTPALAYAEINGDGGFGLLFGRVHRDDVAMAMVKSLSTPEMRNRVLEILDKSSVKEHCQNKIVVGLL